MTTPATEQSPTNPAPAAPLQSGGLLGRIFRTAARLSMSPINAAITLSVRTNKNRWRKVATEVPSWDERNRLIAGLIPAGSSVVDLGSGAMTLRNHLKPGCHYQPCDVVPTKDEVLFCDFNSNVYPALTRTYDFVVCSGVLEYIHDPIPFLTRIATYGEQIILSYNPMRDGETKFSRLGKFWVNHYTQSELEGLFQAASLTFRVVLTRDESEITYTLLKAKA